MTPFFFRFRGVEAYSELLSIDVDVMKTMSSCFQMFTHTGGVKNS